MGNFSSREIQLEAVWPWMVKARV